jgi:hypothetical protein
MNLTELQLLQQKIAWMTDSEFDTLLQELKTDAEEKAWDDIGSINYSQGYDDGYEAGRVATLEEHVLD